MNTIKIDRKNTLMVAHRGVSGLEVENTSLAFVAAGNRSYFGVETDIHCTADGNFIIIHDSHTKRVAGEDTDLVAETTDYATLRQIRLMDMDGSHTREDIRLPSLEEYVGICKKYETVCVLELKHHMEESEVRKIIDRIEAMGYLDSVIFIAFDLDNLLSVRKYRSQQTVQYLFKEFSDEIIETVKKHGFDIDVYYQSLTEEIVQKLHADGIRINCWTVNDPEIAETFVSWGVDYITTNILE